MLGCHACVAWKSPGELFTEVWTSSLLSNDLLRR